MNEQRATGLTRAELDDLAWFAAYWEHVATSPPGRLWTCDGWSWLPWLGDDERRRRTIVWGRWVLALWYCRCVDCRDDRERLRVRVDAEVAP